MKLSPRSRRNSKHITIKSRSVQDPQLTPCEICLRDTLSKTRKKVGCVAIGWCICLSFTVGPYGFCLLPLCTDNCKDTQVFCEECGNTKATV